MNAYVLAMMAMGSALAGYENATSPEQGMVYEIALEANDRVESFRIRLEDPERIRQAEELVRSGERRNLNGALAAGDGGFNAPFSWHLRPATVELPDLVMEVCDGSPYEVQANLGYWLGTVKHYCPWGIQVVRRVPDA